MHHKIESTTAESDLVKSHLLAGVVGRATILSFIFSLSFTLYSISSLDFIRLFKPDLTLLQNTIPRIIFNGIPFLLIGLFLKKSKFSYYVKALLWLSSLPALLAVASLIYVWPIMWAGNVKIYLYVHATNVIIISIALTYIAPTLILMLFQISLFLLFFIGPLLFMLIKSGDTVLLHHFIGEWAIILPATAIVTYSAYKARQEIALLDLKIKKETKAHLGNVLAKAIFEQKQDLVSNRKKESFILKMDIRGFSNFQRAESQEIFQEFMNKYHSFSSRHISDNGGFWHKSDGDAQLGSFGAMDEDVDLSDLSSDAEDIEKAKLNIKKTRFNNALTASIKILNDFYHYKDELKISIPLELGISIDYGVVELNIQGDGVHRKQLEISGKVLTRSARLEEFTKVIRRYIAPNTSVIIIPSELKELDQGDIFIKLTLDRPEYRVRDFPELNQLFYFVYSRESSSEYLDIAFKKTA